jgi:uncharacterized cupin superfamily protein
VVPEAEYEQTDAGVVPKGPGWFVLNAKDALWNDGHFGAFTRFEGPESRFEQLGVNVAVLQPDQPSSLYHGEDTQEDFLILSGECLLLIEGEERRLKAWDFVHCPPWTEHIFVGAGDGPCVLVGVGARPTQEVVYPASELAQRHGAGVEETTRRPQDAYAAYPRDVELPYQEGWLPGD